MQPVITLGMPGGAPAHTWYLPQVAEILEPGGELDYDDELDRQRARLIEETLASFGAPANVVEINRGPTITQFGVEPDFIETRSGRTRVRVGKIASLADDLALALSARTIRIQAPVPGKGYVGIEVPNEEIRLVALRDVIESEAFQRLKSPLRFALGQDVAGNAVAADLTAMPHLLIAGATGSGKSVCVNSHHHLLAAAQHPRRPAPDHGRPQAGRADRLQRHPAPAGAGGGRPGAGGRRAAVGDARDGQRYHKLAAGRLPQHRRLQHAQAASEAARSCPTWWWSSTSWPT